MIACPGKHIEDISHADIVSLLFIGITSAKDSDELSIGVDGVRGKDKTS